MLQFRELMPEERPSFIPVHCRIAIMHMWNGKVNGMWEVKQPMICCAVVLCSTE